MGEFNSTRAIGLDMQKTVRDGWRKKKDDREEGDERADRFPTEISDSVCKGN